MARLWPSAQSAPASSMWSEVLFSHKWALIKEIFAIPASVQAVFTEKKHFSCRGIHQDMASTFFILLKRAKLFFKL